MLTRGKVLLLTILCLLSLVSIGFASWTITESDEEIVYGSMHTYNVINSAQFIQLDTSKGDDVLNEKGEVVGHKGYSVFDYYEYGFLDQNGQPSSLGILNTYYVLNVKQCFELFYNSYNSVNVIIKLHYNDHIVTTLNMFQTVGQNTLSVKYIDISEGLIINKNISNLDSNKLQYTEKIHFNDLFEAYNNGEISDTLYFTVQYIFSAPTGEYFNQRFYETMYKEYIDVKNLFKVTIQVYGSDSIDS